MPLRAAATVETVVDKYVSMEPTTGCWLWTGGRTTKGYAVFRGCTAQSWIYERAVGPIPDGYDVHHKCRVRSCVNPAHLIALSRREHNSWKRTHCKRGHALVGDNVQLTKEGWQNCRKCYVLRPSRLDLDAIREYKRAYYHAHKAAFSVYSKRYRAKKKEAERGN